jgi:hypothetical protein
VSYRRLYYNPTGPATAQSKRIDSWGAESGYNKEPFETPAPAGGEIVLEVTSLKLGHPSPSLFVPPSNCRMTEWDSNTWKNFRVHVEGHIAPPQRN